MGWLRTVLLPLASLDPRMVQVFADLSTDDETPWIALIDQLRGYFDASSGSYLITGAPQCPLSDAFFQMKQMIVGATFDILWIQFYNNQGCDGVNGGFNYDDWEAFLVGTRSAHATLFIGLPASTTAAMSGYLTNSQLETLLDTYATRSSFGGVMLWDAEFAAENTNETTGKTYVEVVKDILATITPTPTTSTTSALSSPTGSCTNTYVVQADDY